MGHSVSTGGENPTRMVWAIALPAMLTNVATALFGLADIWVIGRLGDAAAQGAVELGAKFMLGLLAAFGFLRMGTIALTAQAAGREDQAEQAAALVRALAAGAIIGAGLLCLKPFAVDAGLSLLEAEGLVRDHARDYVGIRYWASMAWLINCVLVGWLIGQRKVKAVLGVEVIANVAHVALDLGFVLGLGWGVAGVAWATVLSELLKTVLLSLLVARIPAARGAWRRARDGRTWDAHALKRLFLLNRDLFLRTLLLTGSILIFARSGAQQGPVTLAANGILFQLFMLSTLLLDGFENAAQVLCGEASGRGDREGFVAVVRVSLAWGMATGVAVSAVYLLFGALLAGTFSTDPQVAEAAARDIGWIVVLPILGVASFVLDGIFLGAGWTRAMLLTMIAATTIYCGLLFAAAPLSNFALWSAFTLLFVIRAVGQLALMPGLITRSFPMGRGVYPDRS